MTERRPPDFLCIGTQKAGTTWLTLALSRHSGVWMPPFKEIAFWRPDGASLSRALGRFLATFQQQAKTGQVDLPTLRWWAHLTLSESRDFAWYQRLFAPAGARITGDITPAYSLMDHDEIGRLVQKMPRIRVILMLRNPVERAWSQLRMYQRLGRVSLAVGEAELRSEAVPMLRHGFSEYAPLMERWESALGSERVHVCFFDDVADAPARVLEGVCRFLGVAPPTTNVLAGVDQRINASPAADFPSWLRRELSIRYLPTTRPLVERFPSPVGQWVADMERWAAGEAPRGSSVGR